VPPKPFRCQFSSIQFSSVQLAHSIHKLCPKWQKKKKDRNWKKKIAKDLVVQKDGVKLCNFASDSIWFRQSLWPYRFGILGQKAGQVSGPSLAHPDPRPLTA